LRVDLEPPATRGLLWAVPLHSKSAVPFVGSVAAAATTGALIAMGHRAGHAAIPFAAIGAVAFQRAQSGAVGLVFTGFVLHLAMRFAWATICVWLARLTRRPGLSAAAVAAANFGATWAIAWATGKGVATVLPLGDRLAFALILAISLGVGMRYAFSAHRSANA